MPLYAYRCTQCGHKFEKIQNFSAEPEKECPKCHGVLERPLTAPRLHFKGAGWYVNDYASKSSEPAPESGSDSAPKTDSKSDSSSTAADANMQAAASETTSTPAATPAPAAPSTPASTS